jgi:hypothetical protein
MLGLSVPFPSLSIETMIGRERGRILFIGRE